MYGLNEISGVEEAHKIVSDSFKFEAYTLEEINLWTDKYNVYLRDVLKKD